jgi:plasmid maintenance system killer protein
MTIFPYSETSKDGEVSNYWGIWAEGKYHLIFAHLPDAILAMQDYLTEEV